MKPKCCNNKKTAAELNKIVEYLKIIAEPNRLKILCFLNKGEKCVCEIWKFLDLPQNLTSHHLKILKDAKLIKSRKQGLKIFYIINKKIAVQYSKSLNKFLQTYGK